MDVFYRKLQKKCKDTKKGEHIDAAARDYSVEQPNDKIVLILRYRLIRLGYEC